MSKGGRVVGTVVIHLTDRGTYKIRSTYSGRKEKLDGVSYQKAQAAISKMAVLLGPNKDFDFTASCAAFLKHQATASLPLEMLRREILDGGKAWQLHLQEVADGEAARAAQVKQDDRPKQVSPHRKPGEIQPSASHYLPDQLSSAEAAKLLAQVLQYVLGQS